MLEQDKIEYKQPSHMTFFGQTLSEMKERYGFTNVSLINYGLDKTSLETLSRLSRRSNRSNSFTQQTIDQITQGVSTAIVGFLTDRRVEIPSDFKDDVEARLISAFRKDVIVASQQPLAISVALRLAELTGRSFLQLEMDINRSKSLEDLLSIWMPKPP